jgi:hypothetical protein
MPHYSVSFFKTLPSSDGHVFKCLQQRIDIPNSEGAKQAAEAATRQFEKLRGLRNWKLLADSVEVESSEPS